MSDPAVPVCHGSRSSRPCGSAPVKLGMMKTSVMLRPAAPETQPAASWSRATSGGAARCHRSVLGSDRSLMFGKCLREGCAVSQAVCCEDGNHCCPRGHTCQPHRSSCSRGPHVLPWFTKVRALTEPSGVADIKCDDKSSCASGTTCCPLKTGGWGCCPLVKV